MVLKSGHIVIELEGGIVTAVWSSDPELDVTVIDHDILDDDDPDDEEMETYKEAVSQLEELKESGDIEQVF